MRNFVKTAVILSLLLVCGRLSAQTAGYDVFTPICKYISKGNAESLSAWFDDNLDIAVINMESTASRAQAKQIMKSFFESYTPREFNITHTAERGNMKYALGILGAGGEDFSVTIFVSAHKGSYKIQQLKIEKVERM